MRTIHAYSAFLRSNCGRNGNTFFAVCDCRAGTFGQLCKHVLGIIEGSDKSVIENSESVAEVASLMLVTEAEKALSDFLQA